MARHFLALRLRVFANGLTRSAGSQRLLAISGLVLGVVVGVAIALGFLAARGRDGVDDAALIFAAVFGLGWLVLPVLLFGSDNTIDPMRFSLLPLTAGQLVRGQLVAGLVGAPTVFAVLTVGAAAYAIADSLPSGVVAGVAAVLTLALAQIASRALTTSIGGALRSRRGRDFALLAGALLAASFYPVQITLQAYLTRAGTSGVGRLASVAAWLPFGWPFAAALRARAGQWGVSLALLLATVALVAALGWVWSSAVVRTLEGPEASGSARSAVSGVLSPAWARPFLPRGPVGAVAAKELRYWWRDPRRRSAALTALVVGVGIVGATSLNGGLPGDPLAFAGVTVALFSTLNCANLFGFDGTAIWSTVAAPDMAAADVRGRQLALALLAGPACLAVTIAGTLLGRAPVSWGAAGAGLCLAVLGGGLGATSVLSVTAPYPVPENPSNPFATGGSGGCSTALFGMVGLATQVAIMAPMLVIVLIGIFGDRPVMLWLVLVIGPVWGFGAATLGARVATGRLERRGPELLYAVTPRG